MRTSFLFLLATLVCASSFTAVRYITPVRSHQISKHTRTSLNSKAHRYSPRRISSKYSSYLTRLWTETSIGSRKSLTRKKLVKSCKILEKLLDTDVEFRDEELVLALRETLVTTLKSLEDQPQVASPPSSSSQTSAAVTASSTSLTSSTSSTSPTKQKKKGSRSVLRGVLMGVAVAVWVFSGNYIFTSLFTLMVLLGQLEYYRGVMSTGVYPARKISVLGSCAMFLTALYFPSLHQLCLPAFSTLSMVWFLTAKRNASSISEIATTFLGMFYIGYLPSFWVSVRMLGVREHTRLAPIAAPILSLLGRKATSLPGWLPAAFPLPITQGAIFTFWCWLAIAFSDVGAYFSGRKYGKTKLGEISKAAGETSPNKTVEGVIGGCLVSGGLGMLGAWVMKWPFWYLSGSVHGVILALLGLVGDLTASMLKRDAGLKDFGDLIPEHGGVLDRVDSFIFSAPYAWFVMKFVLPWLKSFVM
ncbi:hypothetical protein TrVE_jg4364 [Triparma verrucosa]|uniref:Phosphatidate cytidylyltransferase n=1 Tax=Triparma verrucosa TaxID=1606542 RepID=A0A9W7KY85_9STRA|nr:hypothetical protein TrVE_jg4364 [Triparma verrucosa]